MDCYLSFLVDPVDVGHGSVVGVSPFNHALMELDDASHFLEELDHLSENLIDFLNLLVPVISL